MSFPFEQLQVYQLALGWVEDVESLNPIITNNVSRTFIDQLSPGSVFECVPLLEILKRKKLLPDSKIDDLRNKLDHMGRMLTGLIKSLDK